MPKRNLQWCGTVPSVQQKSRIRRCILEFTSETTESYDIFGMLFNDPDLNDTSVPFIFKKRLFLAIFREEFVIVCEDTSLNIKVLIDLWDSKPVDYLEMPFAQEFEMVVQQN